MTEPLFLAALSDPGIGERIRVGGEEGRHAVAARRIRVGEIVLVADGAGTAVRGPVVNLGRHELELEIVEVLTQPEPAVKYVAVQALPKGDRAEQAIEMLTELGVAEIVPWQASRSVVRWTPDRVERGLTRWRSTAREATKQARRFRIPTVTAPVTTAELTQRIARADLALALHEEASTHLGSLTPPSSGEVLFIVGPEGGISGEELDRFVAAGAQPTLIADAVLRTSTAGVVALAQLQALVARGH